MKRRANGFTFIELVVVLSVLGILTLLLFPIIEMSIIRQKEATLKQALLDIRQALDSYKEASRMGLFQSGTESGYPSRLDELLQHRDHLDRPFLRTVPADPFHDGQAHSTSDTWGIRSFQSPADAPQAGRDVYDVYSNSGRVGSNGLPYSEW